jgi:putative transposase
MPRLANSTWNWNGLKKVRSEPLAVRRNWINPEDLMPVTRQCELAGVARSTVYYQRLPVSQEELLLLRLLDEEYTRHRFFGSRKMVSFFKSKGYVVNRKHVQRLMRVLGLSAIMPISNTSKKNPQHKVYPYLLRGMDVVRPNQVWSSDITYIRLAHGLAYLVAMIDWYSRKVLSWRISNTIDADFCVDCLSEALSIYGTPEFVNTDQGSQFTSNKWLDILKAHASLKISMDGRGRALDNIFVERLWRSVKYEDIYLKNYSSMTELYLGLTEYFMFYNSERFHQSLEYKTPDEVYLSKKGGGAKIVNHFQKDSDSLIEKLNRG